MIDIASISKWGWFLVMGILSIFLTVISVWILLSALDRANPYQNIKVEVLTPTVPVGGVFRAKITGERVRLCEFSYIRMIYDFTNTRVTYVANSRDISGELGIDSSLVRLQLPEEESVHPGPAAFKQMFQWRCPWNLVHYFFPITHIVPDVDFMIVPKES